jgi:ion channel-forming bestrophin family protein
MPTVAGHAGHGPGENTTNPNGHDQKKVETPGEVPLDEAKSPLSPGLPRPNPLSRRPTSLDLDDYFVGPRDVSKHSKWPIFLRMHGSILPKMIIPLLVMGIWSTAICLASKYWTPRTYAPGLWALIYQG